MIIPAGPHKLYVAYFFKSNAQTFDTEDEVARDVDCYPLIAWEWEGADSTKLPRPLTQGGLVDPKEQIRIIGEDQLKVRQEAVDMALTMWRAAAGKRAVE